MILPEYSACFSVTIRFPSSEQEVNDVPAFPAFPASFQMPTFAELTESHHTVVFPQDPELSFRDLLSERNALCLSKADWIRIPSLATTFCTEHRW
jgi:hypothetical protein